MTQATVTCGICYSHIWHGKVTCDTVQILVKQVTVTCGSWYSHMWYDSVDWDMYSQLWHTLQLPLLRAHQSLVALGKATCDTVQSILTCIVTCDTSTVTCGICYCHMWRGSVTCDTDTCHIACRVTCYPSMLCSHCAVVETCTRCTCTKQMRKPIWILVNNNTTFTRITRLKGFSYSSLLWFLTCNITSSTTTKVRGFYCCLSRELEVYQQCNV